MNYIITSESVNCGHPDKICDIIADSILDAALRQDANSHMAIECAIKNNKVFIYGEASTSACLNYAEITKGVLKFIGYNGDDFEIIEEISLQSPQINNAVIQNKEMGAGDQGIMYGYATNETKECMPLPIVVAHRLMKVYDEYRRNKNGCYKPDAKSQVSIEYNRKNKPVAIKTILISASHDDSIEIDQIRADIIENVINPTLTEFEYLNLDISNMEILINPSGKFSIYGPYSDSGCVGRKIVVDTYGGVGRIGGGCFSSKDPSKVDRSAAYYARYVAQNLVRAGLADRCEIQVAYSIGKSKPVSIYVDCFGTNSFDMEHIHKWINTLFDFSVENIIQELDLRKPIYRNTACYGHFGRSEFPWENVK